jgi:hypothetical protein
MHDKRPQGFTTERSGTMPVPGPDVIARVRIPRGTFERLSANARASGKSVHALMQAAILRSARQHLRRSRDS